MFRLILTAALLPLAVVFSTSFVGVVIAVAALVVLIDHIAATVADDRARAARR